MKLQEYKLGKNKGFTLIELLVAILLIGLLGAIALPSYLNQAFKAREAEGKSNLGSINRAQQTYRLQMGRMANSLDEIDYRGGGKFYTYAIQTSDRNNATATARLIPSRSENLKNYSSAVTQIVGSQARAEFFGSAICETQEANVIPGAAVAPTQAGETGSCPAGMQIVQ